MKKKVIIAIAAVLTVILAIIIFFVGFYFVSIKPVDKDNNEKITFVVNGGTSIKGLIDNLENAGLIKNRYVGYFYVKLNNVNSIQAGEYTLKKNMSLSDILGKISRGEANIHALNIKFIEGKRLTRYVSDISKQFPYTEEEIMAVLNDSKFIDECINKYWFITDDVKNKDLYYPLEGYLFADTYSIYENASIKDIIFTMLDNMGKKLEPYKNQITDSGYSVHEILTLASMVELEGNSPEDRKMIAQVFKNRLAINMALGSDVTTYYAARKDLIQELSMNELNDCNPYNTRGTCVKGLPVGPIATPSLQSIDAVFNPTPNDYLYFVASKKGNVYYAKTGVEHSQNIYNVNTGVYE